MIGGRAASTTRTPTDPAFLHRVLGLFGLHRLIDRATESAGQLNRRNPEGFDKTVAGVQSEVLRRLPPDTPPAVQNAVRVTCAQCRDARRPGIVAERNGAIADELRTQADTRDREAIAALAAGDATRAATLKNQALGLRAAADRIVPKPGPVEDARGTAETVGPYGDGDGDAPDGDDDTPRVVLAADKGGRSSGDQGDGAPNEMGRRKRLAQYVIKYKLDHRLRPAEEVRAMRRDIRQLFNRARNLKEREFLEQADALGLLPDRARLMYRIAKSDGSNLAELRRSIHREYGDGLYGKHLIEALEISLARGGPDEFLLRHGRTAHPEFVQFLDEFGVTAAIAGATNPGRALHRLARAHQGQRQFNGRSQDRIESQISVSVVKVPRGTPATPAKLPKYSYVDRHLTEEEFKRDFQRSASIDPRRIGTIQSHIGRFVRTGPQGKQVAYPLERLVEALKTGEISASSLPPVRIFAENGKIYTLDHRRLVAGRLAGVRIPFRLATGEEVLRESFKRTGNVESGRIKIRNVE